VKQCSLALRSLNASPAFLHWVTRSETTPRTAGLQAARPWTSNSSQYFLGDVIRASAEATERQAKTRLRYSMLFLAITSAPSSNLNTSTDA
jgi:hypothetical protein